MKNITLSSVELKRLVGKKKANELLGVGFNIKLKWKEIKRIEDRLTKDKIATVRVSNAGNIEVINPRFVTLKPRFLFEKKNFMAVLKKKSKTQEVAVSENN